LVLNQITDSYVVKSANPKLMNNVMANIKIPLPPLDVQQQIVTDCEAIDAEVENAQLTTNKTQAEIDKLVKHCFDNEFPLRKLVEVADIKNGGTPDTKNKIYWEQGTIYWATLVDTKSKYLYNTQRKITQEGLKNSSAVLLPINTVIFSSRATIGEITIAKVETCTNQGYKNFICFDELINYEYLYYILKASSKEIENLATGMTYKEINMSSIKNYKIPVPDLTIQQTLVAEIETLENTKAIAQAVINAAANKKQAVLNQYL
jgi:restriction endonuclease S subunit